MPKDKTQMHVLDTYEDGIACRHCDSPVWMIDTDGESKHWLLCLDVKNVGCCATRDLPECVEIIRD